MMWLVGGGCLGGFSFMFVDVYVCVLMVGECTFYVCGRVCVRVHV